MREIMRTKTMILLAILCLLLVIFASWMAQAERELDAERAKLETEITLLEYEDLQLRDMISQLRGAQAERWCGKNEQNGQAFW